MRVPVSSPSPKPPTWTTWPDLAGYTSYPDNVVTSFIELAASRGIDVFRIFDCFNDVSQMRVSIDAVRKAGKVAEVCICYTADIMTSPIYDVAYYKNLAQQCVEAGAHIIGVKDMAGALAFCLLRRVTASDERRRSPANAGKTHEPHHIPPPSVPVHQACSSPAPPRRSWRPSRR